jgi:thioredoxin 1
MLIRNLTFALALATSLPAIAGGTETYSPARFDQLTAEGKPVLVAVHAGWCPTCRAQRPIVSQLLQRPDFKDLTELVVDYDKDKEALKRFRVSQQSTLIAYKGAAEAGRTVGDTSASGIEALARKSLR